MDSNVRVATYVHGQELWTEVGQNRSAVGQGGLHLFKQFAVAYWITLFISSRADSQN